MQADHTMDVISVCLPQETETPLSWVQRKRFGYRFAYARSSDSKINNDKGQDYLVFREMDQRLAFSLCDGVSQSFFGDLAARILGDALLDWFWENYKNNENIVEELLPVLRGLTNRAREMVEQYSLPVEIPVMVRDVLERKRSIGSESTFVSGLLDVRENRLALVWMGDSRLRLWNAKLELTTKLGDTFHTRERWSSHKGLIGELHAYASTLKSVRRLAVYSDGLAAFDDRINTFVSDETLRQLITETETSATSDDVSLIEVWLSSKMPKAKEKDG